MSEGKEDRKRRLDAVVAASRQGRAQREQGYREQALRLFPWVCGRCGRAFTQTNLRELTVHHKDMDHDNNPADGSNWELLCVYCHDHEHSRGVQEPRDKVSPADRPEKSSLSHSPFANLNDHIKTEK